MPYKVEGRLLEACTCNILCPCWVGEDPDGGTCDGVLAWRVDQGTINGVDVSGLTFVLLAHIPGNILKGNIRGVIYVDDRATPRQQEALVDAWAGKLGGPLADLAGLIGEVAAIERVPINFAVERGQGTLEVGQTAEVVLAPFKGATGKVTALHDTVFTTIPGSPAYVGKASTYRVDAPKYGFAIHLQDHNAIQGSFRFEG